MCLEQKISDYLIRCAKFEYFLIRHNPSFAKTNTDGKITGVNWKELAKAIEELHPFSGAIPDFAILKSDPPGFLVAESGKIDWKKNPAKIDTWKKLLISSFAQLRNNIAHGSKAHPAEASPDRALKLIEAGDRLMVFIAQNVLDTTNPCEEDIVFQ